MSNLDHGAEIVKSITTLAQENDIQMGVFSAVGALQNAELGYYDQDSHQYKIMQVNEPMELVSCTGNISLRGEKAFLHPHASLADFQGRLLGGHLQSGIIFAAEVYMQELKGHPLVRKFDLTTDLYLWSDAE